MLLFLYYLRKYKNNLINISINSIDSNNLTMIIGDIAGSTKVYDIRKNIPF
jgi:hypothetical protein